MNLKIANVVAIQFGILIGLMSWLTYCRFPSAEPNTAAETKRKMVNSMPSDAPVSELKNQRSQTADNRVDRERPQTEAEQRAQAVREYTALAAQLYYQQIAPRRYPPSGPDAASVG